MIRYRSQKQLILSEFDWPFQVALDEENRWVKLGGLIPWDDLADSYYENMSESQGRLLYPALFRAGFRTSFRSESQCVSRIIDEIGIT